MDSGSGLVLFHSSQVYLALFCFTKSVLNRSPVKTILFERKISVSFMQNVWVQIVAWSMKSLVCGADERKLLCNMGTEDVLFSFPFSHVETWLDQHQKKFLSWKLLNAGRSIQGNCNIHLSCSYFTLVSVCGNWWKQGSWLDGALVILIFLDISTCAMKRFLRWLWSWR